jgi:hypothetical protein
MKIIIQLCLTALMASSCGHGTQHNERSKIDLITFGEWRASALSFLEHFNANGKEDYAIALNKFDSSAFEALMRKLKSCSDSLGEIKDCYITFHQSEGEVPLQELRFICFDRTEACQAMLVEVPGKKEYSVFKYKNNEFLIDTLLRTNHNLNGSLVILITKIVKGKYKTDYVSIGPDDTLLDKIFAPQHRD